MMMGCRRSFTMGLGRTPYLFSYFMFATHLKSVIGSVAGTPLLGRVGWGEGGGTKQVVRHDLLAAPVPQFICSKNL